MKLVNFRSVGGDYDNVFMLDDELPDWVKAVGFDASFYQEETRTVIYVKSEAIYSLTVVRTDLPDPRDVASAGGPPDTGDAPE